MTTLTIIREDSFVSVDAVGYNGIDCTILASNVHDVQYDGTNGTVQYNDGTATLAITAISDYTTMTDLWTTAKNAEATAISESETARAAEIATHSWNRVHGSAPIYADIGEQLDQQYHDLLNSTTTWRDAIAAVKAAHPKP